MSVLYDVEEEKKYTFVKKVTCTNCGAEFEDVRIMGSKLRRKEPDQDLRPRFHFLDSLKYGVTSCPYCGFSAMIKNFDKLTSLHQKRLREKVTSQFMQREPFKGKTLDYATAISQYELAFVCAMVMELPTSEQAYLCLQLSWLIRGRLEEADAEPGLLSADVYKQLKEKEERYYRQAYDGLTKAAMEENFPICGMDQATFDYLLAVMSFHFGDYDLAIRYCGNIVQMKGILVKLKDKALMLKDEILEAKKEQEA
ncbi:MAG: DUF2225 domain-containing protein [Eubacterium sp.]|nr:DUF2225 domain-containing protein [Eubacterium sp.]